MTVDRMAQSSKGSRGAPVVDLIAPPAAEGDTAVTGALEGLLRSPDLGELTAAEKDKIVRLDRMKRARAEHKRKYDALGPDVDKLQAELIELVAERQLVRPDGRPYLPDVSDGQGFELHPYFQEMIWPKYREDPETGEPYTVNDLIEALRECGQDLLVIERPDQHPYTGYIREQVKAWRQRVGEVGVVNAEGKHVDAFGNVLVGDEANDPLADILALPPMLRAVIEPSAQWQIKFTRREEASRALAALQAVEGDGADDADATTEAAGDS